MEELFESVKNYLDITWDMSAGEVEKLSGTIKRGMNFIRGKVGPCDFEGETQERELLMIYCMYARSGQTEEFIKNYKHEIISLQINRWRQKKEGEQYAKT